MALSKTELDKLLTETEICYIATTKPNGDPFTYDAWNDFVIHQIFATSASTNGTTGGLVELWYGVGGTTFGANLVQQTFTPGAGATLFNSNQTLGMITAGASNWDGTHANFLAFDLYYRVIGNYTAVSPLTLYHYEPRLASTFSSAVTSG